MAASYSVLSRRPPFTGISNANATAKDYAGASEAVNVRFSASLSDSDATIRVRPGWRKLARLSTGEFTDFLPFREPISSIGTASEQSISSRSTAISGMQLLGGSPEYKTLTPARYAFYNPSRYAVQLARREDGSCDITINEGPVANVTTFTSLVSTLLAGGISSVTYNSSNQYFRAYPSESELAAALLIQSIEPVTTQSEYFTVNGLVLLPMFSLTYGETTTAGLHDLSIGYKALLGDSTCAFGFATSKPYLNNYFTKPIHSNGHIYDPIDLGLGISSVPGNGGAEYAEFAIQVRVHSPDGTWYTGPLSGRFPMSSALDGGTYTVGVTVEVAGHAHMAVGAMLGPVGYVKFEGLRRVSSTVSKPIPGAARVGAAMNGGVISRGCGAGTKSSSVSGLTAIQSVAVNSSVVIWKTKNQASAQLASSAPLYKVTDSAYPVDYRSFSEVITDANLTEVYLPPAVEPDQPDAFEYGLTCGALHQTRALFGHVTGKVYYSLPNEHLNFTSNGYLEFEGSILALASRDDVLYVFTSLGIFQCTGAIGTLDMTIVRISELVLSNTSNYCSHAVIRTNFGVIFATANGNTYLISRNEVTGLEMQLPSTSPVIGEGEYGERISRIRGAYSANHECVFMGNVGAKHLEVLDEKLRWTKYTLPEPLLDVQSCAGGVTILTRSQEGTSLWELDESFTTDSGTDIEWRYASQWEDLEDPRTEKQFHSVSVDLAEGASQNTELTVRTEYDFLAGKPGTIKDFPLRVGQGLGNQPFGRTPWGDKNQTNIVVPLSNERHRSMRVIFEGTKNLAISGWSIEVAGAGVNAKNGTASSALT